MCDFLDIKPFNSSSPGVGGSERIEPDRLGHALGFAWPLESLHIPQMPFIVLVARASSPCAISVRADLRRRLAQAR